MNRHENEWYNRWMSIRRLAVAAFAVTAVLVFVRFNYDGEPLTSDEMLTRYDYTKNELTAAIGKCLSPLHNRNRRWDLYERWQKELKRHTAAERLRIRRGAIAIALTEARREAELLPDDQRQKFAAMLVEQAREFHKDNPAAPVSEVEFGEILGDIPEVQQRQWQPVVAEWMQMFPVEQWQE